MSLAPSVIACVIIMFAKAHHGRVVGDFTQLLCRKLVLGVVVQEHLALAEVAHQLLDGVRDGGVGTVEPLEGVLDVLFGGDGSFDFVLRVLADFIDGEDIQWVRHRDEQSPILFGDGHGAVASRQFWGEHRGELRVWRGVDEVYKRHAPVMSHHAHAVFLANVSELHQ
jgi:hypothetical protein